MVDDAGNSENVFRFVIGGLVVAALAVGFVAFGGNSSGDGARIGATIETPRIPVPRH